MYKIINDSEHNYLRLDPIPSEETVEKYYKEDFYNEKNQLFNDSSLEVQIKDKVFFNSKMFFTSTSTTRCLYFPFLTLDTASEILPDASI